MSTASNGNGQASNGKVPLANGGAPLLLGGMAIAGSPLDLPDLERLANAMFREGPEGAGLGASTEREVMQWTSIVDGAPPSTPAEAPMRPPHVSDPRPAAETPAQPARVVAQPGPADLFGLHNRPLSLSDLGLAEPSHARSEDPAGGAYYFIDEARAFADAPRSGAGTPSAASPMPATPVHPAFDLGAVRDDFPVFSEHVHGRPLVWLDNAATTQKPEQVIARLGTFYRHENSNIHRAAHAMAARATDAFEASRDTVARFIGAPSSDEIVFVRGATEAINLVAHSWGPQNLRAGDEIVLTWLEHHANIVPWQQLCHQTGAILCVAPIDDSGQVMLGEYEQLLGPRTRLVAFAHVSNALGTVLPAREMIEMAHRHGALALVDGAQAVSHMPVDVQELDCDWYAFSGHKVFGPTGIGVLYGKSALLNAMPPWQGGGNMIEDVTFERTLYQPAPARFEAGTASIADAVALGTALNYVDRIGMETINSYEQDLLAYATGLLGTVPGLHLIGTAPDKASILSFVIDGLAAEDIGTALDGEGIAVRAGHHCAQPIIRRFGHESTVRASLAFYNTCAEIDALVAALHRIAGRGVQL